MIKLIVIFFLVLGILYLYCKISGKEDYVDFVSELHCIDSCLITKYDTGGGDSIDLDNANKECTKKCESDCKDKGCNYFDKLNFSKSPPEKIHKPVVTINDENIHVTWFKPKTSKEHPVLRYILIIENDNQKSIEIEIPNKSNSNLMEHYIRGLTRDVYYNIHIYSENDNGLSHPVIIPRVSLRKKNETVEKKEQIRYKIYTPQFDKILELYNNKTKVRKFILKLFKLVQ